MKKSENMLNVCFFLYFYLNFYGLIFVRVKEKKGLQDCQLYEYTFVLSM